MGDAQRLRGLSLTSGRSLSAIVPVISEQRRAHDQFVGFSLREQIVDRLTAPSNPLKLF